MTTQFMSDTTTLASLTVSEVTPGLEVISAIGTPGKVADIYFDPNYQDDDVEKNPVVIVEWDNGNVSQDALVFFDKVVIKNKDNKMCNENDTINYYMRAIDIIMEGDYDAKAVIRELVKRDPKMFCSIIDERPLAVEQWHRNVKKFMIDGSVVEAIKLLRQETKLGLREAKDIVDNVQNRLYAIGYSSVSYRENLAVLKDVEAIRLANVITSA